MADAQLLAAAIHLMRNDTTAAQNAMEIYWAAKGGKGSWSIQQEMAVSPFNLDNAEASANAYYWQQHAGRALAL